MPDGATPDTVTIWGFAAPALSSGRRSWPDALREKAAAKVPAGAGIKQIADEIGTSKSVVARWVRDARGIAPAPEFIEAVPPAPAKAPSRSAGKGIGAAMPVELPAVSTTMAECRIRIGDAEIMIPAGYPTSHLAEVLRAVRTVQ